MGNEEIARNKQFLLFPQCFHLIQKNVSPLSIFLTSYLYLLLKWKSLKLACEVKGLVCSNFGLQGKVLNLYQIIPHIQIESTSRGQNYPKLALLMKFVEREKILSTRENTGSQNCNDIERLLRSD